MTDPTTNAPLRYDANRGSSSGLGIAGLILGGVALLIAWVPCVNFLAALMAVIGLALAAVGLIAASGDKRIGRGMPIAGVVTSLLALLVFVGSYVVVGFAVEKGVEKAAVEIEKANDKARVEMTERAGVLLDEAATFQNDMTISKADRDRLAQLTDRIAEELETEEAGIGNNINFGMMLAELESRLQMLKNPPTTMPALPELPGELE